MNSKKKIENKDNRTLEEKIPEALSKTGFILENTVAEAFRQAKWGVINNRYYVDDVDGRARELDLIAYKVKTGKNVDVVTSLLVSCKKDSEHVWTIMSRARPTQDPNIDWEPVHHWTNNEVLEAFIGSTDWRDNYISKDEELERHIFSIERQAFAFQLVTKNGENPKNDRPIFESLTDLMKAQDHELSILPKRMKKNRIYLFNLVTVVDAPIYEVTYDEEKPIAKEVTEFRHLARYIVRKAELSARIHIVSQKKLEHLVSTYDSLATYNNEYFNALVSKAYESIKDNRSVQSVIAKKLTKIIRLKINNMLRKKGANTLDLNDEIIISYNKSDGHLILNLPLDETTVDYLNSDKKLIEEVSQDLIKFARYSKKFRFEEDIPF
ncbi:MAG: hypothetical protein ACTHOH_18235 [Lysobacteraceae bacterium]